MLRPDPSSPAATAPRVALPLLIAVSALGPSAVQIFLPALPAIQRHFGVEAGIAQLVLSLSMLVMAVAMLVYGPVADRFGRRPTLIAGLSIFVVGSVICTFAWSLPTLIAGRVVQAIGGASGRVVMQAILHDLYPKERAAAMLATVMMAVVAGPMLAPTLGGFLTEHAGWRSTFLATLVIGALFLLWVALTLRETRPTGGEPARSVLSGFADLARIPAFVLFGLGAAASLATFYSFISAAPYVVIQVMGRSAGEYGVWFVVVALTYLLGNFVTSRIVERTGPEVLALSGNAACLAVIAVMAWIFRQGHWTPVALFVPASAVAFCAGMVLPNAQASAIALRPDRAGTASGLIGSAMLLVSAVFAQLAGSLQNGTPYPLAGLLFAATSLSLLAVLGGMATRRQRAAT